VATIQRQQFLFLVGRVLVGGMYLGAGLTNLGSLYKKREKCTLRIFHGFLMP
jgi:hypothetical protein